MQSLLKLNKGDSKGWNRLGSSLNCWYAIIYMIYVELPLSTNTLLVLNPFIANMMTSGSSYGCLIPLASHSEKVMSSSPERQYFTKGCLMWTLLICLWNALFKDFYDPLVTSLLVIILISPTACFWWSRSTSLWSSWICPLPLTETDGPFWQTSEVFPSGLILRFAPSNHDIHQCNDHDPYESDNTSLGLVS